MKFTCLKENLSKGLSTVNKAVSVRSTLPILSNILIVADSGRVKLSAFNMETGISTFVGASVETDGSITIPAKLFTDFVSNVSADSITAELKNLTLHLTTSKNKSRFNGMEANGFPELPQMTDDLKTIHLDSKQFCQAILSVGYSASTDESRPILEGILLSQNSGVLTMVTADGYRLTERKIKLKTKVEDFSVVIPAKTLIEVARMFLSSGEDIKFAIDKNESLALFESNNILVSTRIIDGQFPDYKKLIPEETSFSANLSVGDLLEAVKLTSLFTKGAGDTDNNAVTLNFDNSGKIKISSNSMEVGQNESEIDAKVSGENLSVSFNFKYLLDFLNNIKVENVTFSTNGNSLPCVFTTEENADFLHIIMPLRIQN